MFATKCVHACYAVGNLGGISPHLLSGIYVAICMYLCTLLEINIILSIVIQSFSENSISSYPCTSILYSITVTVCGKLLSVVVDLCRREGLCVNHHNNVTECLPHQSVCTLQ